jgi:hypothetical protein
MACWRQLGHQLHDEEMGAACSPAPAGVAPQVQRLEQVPDFPERWQNSRFPAVERSALLAHHSRQPGLRPKAGQLDAAYAHLLAAAGLVQSLSP